MKEDSFEKAIGNGDAVIPSPGCSGASQANYYFYFRNIQKLPVCANLVSTNWEASSMQLQFEITAKTISWW